MSVYALEKAFMDKPFGERASSQPILEAYDTAIAEDPQNIALRFRKMNFLVHIARKHPAMMEFHKAMEETGFSREPVALLHFAQSLMDYARYDEALYVLDVLGQDLPSAQQVRNLAKSYQSFAFHDTMDGPPVGFLAQVPVERYWEQGPFLVPQESLEAWYMGWTYGIENADHMVILWRNITYPTKPSPQGQTITRKELAELMRPVNDLRARIDYQQQTLPLDDLADVVNEPVDEIKKMIQDKPSWQLRDKKFHCLEIGLYPGREEIKAFPLEGAPELPPNPYSLEILLAP